MTWDPFFALIQALAGAAHLATPNQFKRLATLPRQTLLRLDGPPRLDIFILFVERRGEEGKPPKGAYMPALTEAAQTLAAQLLALDAVAAHVRRIAGLALRLDDHDALQTEVRWAWAREGSQA